MPGGWLPAGTAAGIGTYSCPCRLPESAAGRSGYALSRPMSGRLSSPIWDGSGWRRRPDRQHLLSFLACQAVGIFRIEPDIFHVRVGHGLAAGSAFPADGL